MKKKDEKLIMHGGMVFTNLPVDRIKVGFINPNHFPVTYMSRKQAEKYLKDNEKSK